MTAHQRLIREQRAQTEAGEGLFGAYWEDINRDIGNTVVREIDRRTAETVILRYEWLACMPAVSWHHFGIYYDDVLACVAVYGPEYAENLGVWDKYGYTGKLILLSRGACTHWAHPHTGSKLIRRSMDLLPAKYEVVTATVDEAAGEIGTIYQACGFSYVASMRQENPNTDDRAKGRHAFLINGKIVGERQLRSIFGHSRKDAVLAAFPDAVYAPQFWKRRYFAFRGSPAVKRKHLAAIAHLVRPYPKRAVGVEETSPAIQSGSAGAMPARRSNLALGDDLPPIAKGKEPIEVGWHPVCGHVRHISVHHRLDGGFSPALTYGVLPNDEARARMGECDVCRPPVQEALAL